MENWRESFIILFENYFSFDNLKLFVMEPGISGLYSYVSISENVRLPTNETKLPILE